MLDAPGTVPVRAAVCRAYGQPMAMEELRLSAPREGEVRVRIEAVAVCHSDISLADGGWPGPLPAVYGHEAAGRVLEAGPGVRGLDPGRPVIVTLIRACGACVPCATGRPAYCAGAPSEGPLATAGGEPVLAGMDTGAFAEAVTVHASQVAPVPEEMPMEAACLLSCGVVTGVGAAVNAARVRVGEDVVVIGAGGVGLNAVQGARLAGARRIVAVDLSEAKLEDARQFGATDGVLASAERPWREAKRILGRGADAVIVTVGAAAAYDAAPRYLAPCGRAVAVGMPHSGATASYEPVVISATGTSLIGSRMGDTVLRRDVPWMCDLWAQGRLKLEELITGRWSLERIEEAFADTRAGRARRNVILL